MEQWQFLIQKEGERNWHPLGKPSIKIMEGRYRVVARSSRINTDVEVCVTHSSTSETPPRRRIQKRKRRINSEGLTAIIPFTHLKSGIWELKCSGDLMSELLGESWQYTVSLVVTPCVVEGKNILPTNSVQNLDKQFKGAGKVIQTNETKSKIENVKSSSHSPSSNDLKTDDSQLISDNVEFASTKSHKTNIRKPISISPKPTLKNSLDKIVSEKPAQKLRESLQARKADQNKAVSNKPVNKSIQKPQDSTDAIPTKTGTSESAQKKSQKSKISNKTVGKKFVKKSLEKSKALNKTLSKKPVKKSPDQPKIESQAIDEKPEQQGNFAIIESTANPLRVKGDTAEQILQNLIELALPSSESLLADETFEDKPIAAPPLPLLLTLDRVNYVADWGTSITIDALVQLKQTGNEQIKTISKAEVQIELRSPQNLELLKSIRQSNPNKSLPFAITSSIDIPQKCDSKLILGEVKVYGVILGNDVLELLASQSFTITANVKELLAITVVNPQFDLDNFGYSTDELSAQNTPQILEADVSLDLELFNLAKAAKAAKPEKPVSGVPSTKKSLPPRIDPRMFRTRVATPKPKLPNVPGYQEKIDEYINKGHIETLRGSNFTGTTFPYLRKLKALPSSTVEIDVDVYEVDKSTYTSEIDNQNLAQTIVQVDNISEAELVVDKQKDDNYFEFEQTVTYNSEFVVPENTNTSPLIRQWMLSQGYSLPEPIDVEYEDYDISVSNQEISYQQNSLSPQSETDDKHYEFDREKPLETPTNLSSSRNIQVTSSPYFSISSTSEWEINHIATPSTQIEQEIVVDDTEMFADNKLETENQKQDQSCYEPVGNISTTALTVTAQEIEELPIPQIHIPQGELPAGKSVHIRVRLPEGNSNLAVKLWLEDCQTRYLLDGPHLLSNLTPNNNRELEVITKLNIPFGCLEIRLEAIAINTSTQQESHKSTIQRTVVPPDLPNIQFDAIVGM